MSDNPERCVNYLKIVRLIVDVGTNNVRDLFYFYKPKEKISGFFESETISDELLSLKRKHVITAEQYMKITCNPNPDDFDLSLLITLLVNLFKWTIEKPVNGWDIPVAENDSTLGGSLLRLRILRNSLVGHSRDASLTTEEFEDYWEQAACILNKIASVTNNEKIAEVIESYKSSPLDCDHKHDDKYITLLRQWYAEGVSALLDLQTQVEELCEKTNELTLFFKSDIPERYKRYVLLLVEGGMLVLAAVLKRELLKANQSLENVLMINRSSVLSLSMNGLSSCIYKDDRIETDVTKWGLRNLTDIILHMFSYSLSKMERKAVFGIGKSVTDYAKAAVSSLDSDKFPAYWTDIVANINILAVGLDDVTQEACEDLIQKHDNGPVNDYAVHIYLLQLRQDALPDDSLIHQYLDTRKKLRLLLEQMQREGACFGKDQAVELKMMTHGKTEEKRELAENILFEVWQTAVNLCDNPTNFEAIREEVHKVLKEMKELKNVKISTVEKHCIILTFTCTTCLGLLQLLDFVDTALFQQSMESFSQTLSNICEESIIVTAFFTIDSMLATMKSILCQDRSVKSNEICFEVKCSSLDAVNMFRQFVDDNTTSNNMNNIAQALTEELGEKISIETRMELKGLGTFFDNYDCIHKSEWTPYTLPPAKGTERLSLFYEDHFKQIVRDIKNLKPTRSMYNSIKPKRLPRSLSLPDLSQKGTGYLGRQSESLRNLYPRVTDKQEEADSMLFERHSERNKSTSDILSLFDEAFDNDPIDFEEFRASEISSSTGSSSSLESFAWTPEFSQALRKARERSQKFGSSSSFGSFASAASCNSTHSVLSIH